MPWPRPWSLSAMCPLVSALSPLWPRPPNLVSHVSALCPPCVRLLSPLWPRPQNLSALCPALCPLWPRLRTLFAMCLPCLLSALCPPCARLSPLTHLGACPPCVRLVFWPPLHASGLCRSWPAEGEGHGIIKYFSPFCATHSVYIACPPVCFLGIHFGYQIQSLQARPMLQ